MSAPRTPPAGVDGELLATEGDVRARVPGLRLWEEVNRAQAGFAQAGPACEKDKLAVMVLDATRFARSGPLMEGLADHADSIKVRLYTAFMDANATRLVSEGVVAPAGVPRAELAIFLERPEHIDSLPHLRNFFMLPGSACTFAPVCIASGDPHEPAPAGNLAWAVWVAVQGGLSVTMLRRGLSFQTWSSPPIAVTRAALARPYRLVGERICPAGEVHTKLYNVNLRQALGVALHSQAVPEGGGLVGPNPIPGAQHLSGSAAAAVATYFRDDAIYRTRTAAVGYLASLPELRPGLRRRMLPFVQEAMPVDWARIRPRGDQGLQDSGLRVRDLIAVDLRPHPDLEGQRLFLMCRVAAINTGQAPDWWGDEFLRPQDLRVGVVTGAVEVFRCDFTGPILSLRRVVRQYADPATPDELDPPVGVPPFEVFRAHPVRHRPPARGEDERPVGMAAVGGLVPIRDGPGVPLMDPAVAAPAHLVGQGERLNRGRGGGRQPLRDEAGGG